MAGPKKINFITVVIKGNPMGTNHPLTECNMPRWSWLLSIFILAFIVRFAWAYFSSFDNFSFQDWSRYNRQSDQILDGDFNLEEPLFIVAPLFPYLVAIFKLIFGYKYVGALEIFQITLSSLSVVYLCLTAKFLFKSDRIAILTGIFFSLYPITLYWVHVFGQETIFQALLIIGLYYFVAFLKLHVIRFIIAATIILSLATLTKSHILLLFPFLLLTLMLTSGLRRSLVPCFILVGGLLVITMPYGIYNKVVNDTYIIASSGSGGFFLTGHNDDVYRYIVDPPLPDSADYQRLKNMDFYVFSDLEGIVSDLSHSQKQSVFMKAGVDWVFENPSKAAILALVNFKNFVQPGFNKAHHPSKRWILALALSLPVFLLAYFEIVRSLQNNWREHLVVVSLFLSMAAFSVIFYSQNRFRVVTIEPWYLMYACSGFIFIYQKFISRLKRDAIVQ